MYDESTCTCVAGNHTIIRFIKSELTSVRYAAEPSTHSPEYQHHPQIDQHLQGKKICT